VKKRLIIGLLLVSLIATVALALRASEPGGKPEANASSVSGGLTDPVQVLRTDFQSLDFEAGVVHGRMLWALHPDMSELAAWYALNAARSHNDDEALQVAERLLRADANDPWAQFALAAALIWDQKRGDDALTASARALEHSPENVDFLWLRAETLRLRRPKDEAIHLLDAQGGILARSADLLVVKGAALYDQSMAGNLQPPSTREGLQRQALDAFASARRIDATSVSARYTPAWFLTNSRRALEAYPLLTEAAELSPSPKIHVAFWHAVQNNWKLTVEQKRAIVASDIYRFVERRAEHPSTVTAALEGARLLGLTAWREKLERQLERERRTPPDSAAQGTVSDAVQMDHIEGIGEAIRSGPGDQATRIAEYRALLNKLIEEGATHHDQGVLNRACIMLFDSVRTDDRVAPDELIRVVDLMKTHVKGWPHIVYAEAAIALADRGADVQAAERLARSGVAAIPTILKEAATAAGRPQEDGKRERRLVATMHDALGRVHHRQGRLQEAEEELRLALEAEPRFPATTLHLAQLYQAMGDSRRAEELYVKGISLGGEVRAQSLAALGDLYKARRGDTTGYPAYLARAQRESLALSRVANASRPDAFVLEETSGAKVSLDALRGKYVVVVFWELSCPACRQKIPELADVHEAYKASNDVVFVTINSDRNPDQVRAFMQDQHREFKVLFDDGYTVRSGVVSVPTTWILDRQGRKVFEMDGASGRGTLLEELRLRLDFLRERNG
jgi:tetratricopeptide (TPR) repeat protein